MRQVLLAVLISLFVMGVSAKQSLAQFTLGATDISPEMTSGVPDPALTSSHLLPEQILVVAQNTTKKNEKRADDKNKDKNKDKEKKRIPDRVSNYKCVEYCAVVRQSCEGLARIQPVSKVSDIGSKENNEWSKKVQKIYTDCMNKCNFDEEKVHWKRFKPEKVKNNK
jgi:hypothetical protein